jgi:hypothetical protein
MSRRPETSHVRGNGPLGMICHTPSSPSNCSLGAADAAHPPHGRSVDGVLAHKVEDVAQDVRRQHGGWRCGRRANTWFGNVVCCHTP